MRLHRLSFTRFLPLQMPVTSLRLLPMLLTNQTLLRVNNLLEQLTNSRGTLYLYLPNDYTRCISGTAKFHVPLPQRVCRLVNIWRYWKNDVWNFWLFLFRKPCSMHLLLFDFFWSIGGNLDYRTPNKVKFCSYFGFVIDRLHPKRPFFPLCLFNHEVSINF
jgi:hypothetical protein